MTEEESTEMVTATRSRVHRKEKKEGAEFELHKWNSISAQWLKPIVKNRNAREGNDFLFQN